MRFTSQSQNQIGCKHAQLCACLWLLERKNRLADQLSSGLHGLSDMEPANACRYFQMVGMRRRRIWYRLNTVALFVAFTATHILSVLYVLHVHCRSQRLPWHKASAG